MNNLKFYDIERELFPKEFELKLSNFENLRIARKLARHFKIQVNLIKFKRGRFSLADTYFKVIQYLHNTSLGSVCHELAHLWNEQKFNNSNHNKKLMRTIEKLVIYCRKKNYFASERERWLNLSPLTEKAQKRLYWRNRSFRKDFVSK